MDFLIYFIFNKTHSYASVRIKFINIAYSSFLSLLTPLCLFSNRCVVKQRRVCRSTTTTVLGKGIVLLRNWNLYESFNSQPTYMHPSGILQHGKKKLCPERKPSSANSVENFIYGPKCYDPGTTILYIVFMLYSRWFTGFFFHFILFLILEHIKYSVATTVEMLK